MILFVRRERLTLHGRIRLIETDVVTGRVIISPWKKNLIVTAGKDAILRRLGGVASGGTNEGKITYGAVGTGTTTPVVGDTTLTTELARVAVSRHTVSGLTLTIRAFFNSAEGNGTWTEFGWFGEEATAEADTGTLFNHVLISKVKSTSKTVTVEQQISYD